LAQVLDALAVALRLDDDGWLHLFRLAGLAPRPRSAAVSEKVDPNLLQLMEAGPNNPALVYNRAYDVLASNRIADVLFEGFAFSRNLMLLVPGSEGPAVLRRLARGRGELGGRLPPRSRRGPRRSTGARGTDRVARAQRGIPRAVEHARCPRQVAGDEAFPASAGGRADAADAGVRRRSAPGQELVVYHAEPASCSAETLSLLSALVNW
jgi:hypothetical protein